MDDEPPRRLGIMPPNIQDDAGQIIVNIIVEHGSLPDGESPHILRRTPASSLLRARRFGHAAGTGSDWFGLPSG
jgi:hypothetical protein